MLRPWAIAFPSSLLLVCCLGAGCNFKLGPIDWDGGGGPCVDSCAPEGGTSCSGPLVTVCRRNLGGCLSNFLDECPGSQICTGVACADAPVVWSQMEAGTGESLVSVWGSSGSDVFAVGDRGTILHYDGFGWSPQSSGTMLALHGVWGRSGSDVFAVGEGGTVLHYDGAAWSARPGLPDACLGDVWGTAEGDVFAFGFGGLFRWNGETWSDLGAPAGPVGGFPRCGSLWGSSPADILGVGYSVYRFDGSTWSGPVADPVRGDGVWGSARDDVFVVGDCVFHFDGSAWSTHAPCDGWNRYGVWGRSASDVFTVGRAGGIQRYDGSAWTAQNSGTRVSLFGVWGSPDGVLFTVGEGGTILRHGP